MRRLITAALCLIITLTGCVNYAQYIELPEDGGCELRVYAQFPKKVLKLSEVNDTFVGLMKKNSALLTLKSFNMIEKDGSSVLMFTFHTKYVENLNLLDAPALSMFFEGRYSLKHDDLRGYRFSFSRPVINPGKEVEKLAEGFDCDIEKLTNKQFKMEVIMPSPIIYEESTPGYIEGTTIVFTPDLFPAESKTYSAASHYKPLDEVQPNKRRFRHEDGQVKLIPYNGFHSPLDYMIAMDILSNKAGLIKSSAFDGLRHISIKYIKEEDNRIIYGAQLMFNGKLNKAEEVSVRGELED